MKDETVYEAPINTSTSLVRRISWAAIFAGLVVAIVIEMVLSVLGISIGATVVNPMSDSTTARNLGIGEAIWFLVVSIISLFIGGWVAGRSSGLARGDAGDGVPGGERFGRAAQRRIRDRAGIAACGQPEHEHFDGPGSGG